MRYVIASLVVPMLFFRCATIYAEGSKSSVLTDRAQRWIELRDSNEMRLEASHLSQAEVRAISRALLSNLLNSRLRDRARERGPLDLGGRVIHQLSYLGPRAAQEPDVVDALIEDFVFYFNRNRDRFDYHLLVTLGNVLKTLCDRNEFNDHFVEYVRRHLADFSDLPRSGRISEVRLRLFFHTCIPVEMPPLVPRSGLEFRRHLKEEERKNPIH